MTGSNHIFDTANGAAAVASRPSFDFIVCGAGSSGCVVAGRLAENPDVSVLLVEAGGDDEAEAVMDPAMWPANLGGERDWGFRAAPNPHLGGRSLPMSMGRCLGGGSSINVMVWARGHRSDWDFYAAEAGDPSWGYDAVLRTYRGSEDWRGRPDPAYRGTGGPVTVQPPPEPSPVAYAMLEAAASLGIPVFESQNGRMMEGAGGCALTDTIVRDGRRHSMYRAYVGPHLGRPNLVVLTGAVVTRLLFDRAAVRGVELLVRGEILEVAAGSEVVLSAGAVNTPRILMCSGIGDESELRRLSLPMARHLPGVGQNFQDHVSFQCIWEYKAPIPPRHTGNEATLYWKSRPDLPSPDLLFCQAEFPAPSAESAARGTPEHGWTMFAGLAQPKSRGRVRLTGADPAGPVVLDAGMLSHPDDVRAGLACVEFCRELGNAAPFRPLNRREVAPGPLGRVELESFLREAAVTYWHQCGTARMGRDSMAVVDGDLKVHGVERLRIADSSVLPRLPTGNTMAPCVVIGERAAEKLRGRHAI